MGGGKDSFAKQQEENLSAVVQGLPNNDTGRQMLHHSTDYPNLKFNVSEGAGISVLLKRTSNSMGPVVRGRNFSAASIPYDDLSYAKDSASSMRSSIGHGSFSTSSSVDFGSRQMDSRVQRQLSSGRKTDMEHYRNEKNTKHQNAGLSFSGIANLSRQASSLSTNTHEDNSQVSTSNMKYVVSETLLTSQEHLLASERTEANVSDTPVRTSVVEEDDYEQKGTTITVDSSTSELLIPAVGIGLEENLVESHRNYEDCGCDVELPKDASSVAELEELETTPGSSCKEENVILNVDKMDTEISTHSSMVTVSEIETENCNHISPGSLSDNVSLASKSTSEELLEPSPFNPSDKGMIASARDSKISDQAHDILGMICLGL